MGRVGGRGQDGCELRIEVFSENSEKKILLLLFFFLGGGGVGSGEGGGWGRVGGSG